MHSTTYAQKIKKLTKHSSGGENNNRDDTNDMPTMNNSFFSTPHLAPLPEEVNLSYASDTTSQQSHDSYDSGFGESGAGGKEELLSND